MSGIRMETLFEKMLLVLSISLLIQLMFTIGSSHQTMEVAGKARPHSDFQLRGILDQSEGKPRLRLSDKFIELLMKKFSENPKLQEYLKVLKKKKYDTDDEDPIYDYQYQTKYRF